MYQPELEPDPFAYIPPGPTMPPVDITSKHLSNMSVSAGSSSRMRLTTPPITSMPTETAKLEELDRIAEKFEQNHASFFSDLKPFEGEDIGSRRRRLEDKMATLDPSTQVDRERIAVTQALLELLEPIGSVPSTPSKSMIDDRPATIAGEPPTWKPLRLLTRKSSGHLRSASSDASPTPRYPRLSTAGNTRPIDSPTPLANRSVSDNHPTVIRRMRSLSETNASDIEMLSLPTNTSTSNAESSDTSIAASTYSWATQFSGETAELRAAAQYALEEYEEEVLLDTPQKRQQDRNRLVHIAHTVRRLEGIGSPDNEDPNLFHKLAEAWNSRNPPHTELTGNYTDGSYSSKEENVPINDNHVTFSPSEPDLVTPALPNQRFPVTHPELSNDTDLSAHGHLSYRSSFASVLHDLGESGGYAQGRNLMDERAWMRPSQRQAGTSNSRYSDMFNPRPPPEGFFQPGSHRPPSILISPIAVSKKRDLTQNAPPPLRPASRGVNADIHSDEDKGTSEPAPMGLGIMGNWWGARPNLDKMKVPEMVETVHEEIVPEQAPAQDFHQGEDGSMDGSMIKRYSSPFSAAYQAAAAINASMSASMSVSLEEEEDLSNPNMIGLALTTSTAIQPHQMAKHGRQKSIDQKTLLNMRKGVNEYPSSNPYQHHKSSIPSIIYSPPTLSVHHSEVEEPEIGIAEAVVIPVSASDMGVPLHHQQMEVEYSDTLESGYSPLPDLPPRQTSLRRQSHPQSNNTNIILSQMPRPSTIHLSSIQEEDPFHLPVLLERHVREDQLVPLQRGISQPSHSVVAMVEADQIAVHPLSPMLQPRNSDHLSSPHLSNGIVSSRYKSPNLPVLAPVSDRINAPPSSTNTHRFTLESTFSLSPSPRPVSPRRSTSVMPVTMFFLGFFMPWCWIFGGWPVSKTPPNLKGASPDPEETEDNEDGAKTGVTTTSTRRQTRKPLRDAEKGQRENQNSDQRVLNNQLEQGESWFSQWIYHPDPWARRCRIAAAIGMPIFLVAAIGAIVVLAIVKH